MVVATKVQIPDGTMLLEPQEIFNPCLIGIIHQASNYVALYSRKQVIQALIDGMEMSEEDALEHYDFNVSGSAGWGFPYFLVEEEDWLDDDYDWEHEPQTAPDPEVNA